MDVRSLQFVAAACAGQLMAGSPDAPVRRVCTDSRQVQPGDLFFALKGDRFDGHDFLAGVAQKGVAAVVVERAKVGQASRLSPNVGAVVVEDTRAALGKLAARYRADFKLPIIAIGGSNGKTTTKELLASVLCQQFNTLWSEASFNNDVGVPLTLLRLEPGHQAAVLEVGTNHPGELEPLLRMIQPQYGVLTNIGREHLEFFGDLAGVAQEEGWLGELLPASGKLFLNGDNEWTAAVVKRTRAAVVKVGFGEQNDWRARNVRLSEDGVKFEVISPWDAFSGEWMLRVLGRHQVPNALLALAAGAELGVSPPQARRGLAECPPPKMRLQIWETSGVSVLDDTYNANADSMLAALETLRDLPCAGRRIAVLGDMAEQGEHAADAHREVGRRSAELRVGCLVAVGRWAAETGQAARAAGLQEVIEFADVESAVKAVKNTVRPGDVVLIKASRAAGFERMSAALRGG